MLKKLAMLGALVLCLGMPGPGPELKDTTVVQLTEPGCPPLQSDAVDCWHPEPAIERQLVLQMDFGGDKWLTLSKLAGKLQPGDCVSAGALKVQSARACCSCQGALACSEPADHALARPHCPRIFRFDGDQYDQDEVDEYNAADEPQ